VKTEIKLFVIVFVVILLGIIVYNKFIAGKVDTLGPLAEPEVLDRLSSLKKKLEELEENGLDLNVAKNLREAIDEAEHGHHTASGMISSRVICYLIDRIPGNGDEEKINYLIERGMIPKDRKDVQKQLIKSMRLFRNALSHRIDLFPDSEDAIMLLCWAFNLARLALPLKMEKDPKNLPQRSNEMCSKSFSPVLNIPP